MQGTLPTAVQSAVQPAPSAHALDAHVVKTYGRSREVFVEGCGAHVRTAEGRVFLDFLGGIAVSALGHAHPRLVEALRDQVGKLVHTSNLYRHPYTEEVATRLARLTGLEAMFFANSGAEANECALKLSRKWQRLQGRPERTNFLALEGGFHGRTMGALSVTHAKKYREAFEPLVPCCAWVAPNDAAALEQALETIRPAAFIMEPIQGEAGVRDLSHDYLRAARELCTRTGTVLVHDEVQAGCGRTGTFLAGAQAGVLPDVATLAKPIAGGLPMGVCAVAEPFVDTLQPGDHGTTFGGGPLALRAALVFLEELEERGLMRAVEERGAQLRRGLEALQARHAEIVELRGRGLIQGVRLSRGAEELQKALHENGLLANRTGGDTIRLLPPFVVTEDDVSKALDIFAKSLSETLAA
jgi:predicted acetylornithine/succinylornithine family transaminase